MDIDYFFNKVDNMTAICCSKSSFMGGERPELEIGKTYKVSHYGVQKSCQMLILEENGQEYYAQLFDLYEDGKLIERDLSEDVSLWAPYLRARHNHGIMKNENIPTHIGEIEEKYNVKVLLAVESGSRAWGFESEDSDWDLRFVYVHKPNYYLSIKEQRDTIEYVFDDDCDAAGWELRKALRLFKKCNPVLLEWINSPIVYYANKEFVKRIEELQAKVFNPIGIMYHYHGMYNKDNERYLDRLNIPLKKFLYYLRGILACKWVYERKTLPPVQFGTLVYKSDMDEDIKNDIYNLVSYKKYRKEADISLVNERLMAFAKEQAEYYNSVIGSFRPEDPRTDVAEDLDKLMLDMVEMFR